MVPVHILAVPVLALVLKTEEHGELRNILLLGDHHQTVVGFKAGFTDRSHCRVGIAPDARDDELGRCQVHDILHFLVEKGRVLELERSKVRFLAIVLGWMVGLLCNTQFVEERHG